MNTSLLLQNRRNFLSLLDGLTINEVNVVPANFNNNLVWHLGHIIVTQQMLCYQLSGLEPVIDVASFVNYRRGTKPDGVVTEDEYNRFKELSIELMEKFLHDYEQGIFKEYTPVTITYGGPLTINSIDDAVSFITLHEGLHYGYSLALKRAVVQQAALSV